MKPHAESTPKWNIIFLIYAEIVDTTTTIIADPATEVDDIRKELDQLNDDLLSVEVTKVFNLFTVKNVLEVKNDYVVSDTTVISKLIADATTGNNTFKQLLEPAVQDFIQNGGQIRNIFQYIDQNYPADKTLLVTWDHGSVFGIFKKIFRDKVSPALIERKYEAIRNGILDTAVDGTDELLYMVKNRKLFYDPNLVKLAYEARAATIPTTEVVVDILTNDELAEAITYGFKSKCVDVLIMFNCNMQNMHTCYSFRNCVKYLVAPQDAIATPGYDYISIIKLIGSNSSLEVDGATVAAFAVNSLKEFFLTRKSESKLDRYAVFAVCLLDYEKKVIGFMEELVLKLMTLCDDTKIRYKVNNQRNKCYTYGRELFYDQVDLANLLIRLNNQIKDDDLLRLSTYFQSMYTAIIVAKSVGNNIYNYLSSSWEATDKIPPTGVTIYYPITSPKIDGAVIRNYISRESPFASSLISRINWDNALNKIYAKSIFKVLP